MQLNGINENPISSRWKKRLSEQPIEVQNKIKELDTKNPKDYQLKVIKKSKVEPKEGDVFLICPRDGVYFYGRVLKVNIEHIEKDTFIHGKYVVVIFKSKTKDLKISEYVSSCNELLIGPEIVDASYWSKGLFFTVANIPIEPYEEELDYGFYSIGKGKFFKENGVELTHQPQIFGTYGIATITAVARNVEKELIFDSNLLTF